MDGYPPSMRNRFTVKKPEAADCAVFFHPGEPVFDRLASTVTGLFADDALRGAAFVDAQAHAPYAFQLALVNVIRRADPTLPALARPELVESLLVGLCQNGKITRGYAEQLLLLRDTNGSRAAAPQEAAAFAARAHLAEAYAREIGRGLSGEHRARVEKSVTERRELLRAGYDYEEADSARSTPAAAGEGERRRP